mmetsp:Transcript_28611/g.84684  ORF Transcript_28611/g.84684 Transcript_28611/m.84684 type:complete len:237 (+) Transcript_28611:1150-1860(+)
MPPAPHPLPAQPCGTAPPPPAPAVACANAAAPPLRLVGSPRALPTAPPSWRRPTLSRAPRGPRLSVAASPVRAAATQTGHRLQKPTARFPTSPCLMNARSAHPAGPPAGSGAPVLRSARLSRLLLAAQRAASAVRSLPTRRIEAQWRMAATPPAQAWQVLQGSSEPLCTDETAAGMLGVATSQLAAWSSKRDAPHASRLQAPRCSCDVRAHCALRRGWPMGSRPAAPVGAEADCVW